MKKRVVVASKNPVKIDATKQGFVAMFRSHQFEIVGVSVPSGVRDQPMSNDETLMGAQNRALNAEKELPGADYYVGIEGGIEEIEDALQAFAWVVVRSEETVGKAQTGIFYLPDEVSSLIRQGMELGHANDIVFRRDNSKQQNGSVGLLTGDVIGRTGYYAQAVILALIPFKNPMLGWK